MSVGEEYERHGHAALPGFIPPEAARAFLFQLQGDLQKAGIGGIPPLGGGSPLLTREAFELYGFHYPPMITFLWGMTAAVRALTGADLLPTYSYFRIYRQGDVCRVHTDRPSCEYSISLTLAYSDDEPWPLEVGSEHIAVPKPVAVDDFEGAGSSAVAMQPGDAVLYQGVHRRHGRTMPNPNRWSAHLFLHWVARDGPYANTAFDGRAVPARIDLAVPA